MVTQGSKKVQVPLYQLQYDHIEVSGQKEEDGYY